MSAYNTDIEFALDENALIKTNIFIIWLDKQIGKEDACVLLKSSFFLAGNPTDVLFERELDREDIARSIKYDERIIVRLDTVPYMFQAFEDIEKCFTTIGENLNKRIFLITSGSKGRFIVPALLSQFPQKFIPNYWIYVFCGKMNMRCTEVSGDPTNDWALDYENNALLSRHQDELLLRIVLDMSNYFFDKAEQFERSKEYANALEHYQWSKLMLERYDKIDKRKLMSEKVNQIAQKCAQIQEKLQEQLDEPESTEALH